MKAAIEKQKRAVVYRIGDSPLFEEVHFIFKSGAGDAGDSEIVKEANRIIAAYDAGRRENSSDRRKKKERRARSSLFYYVFGMFSALFLIVSGVLMLNFCR